MIKWFKNRRLEKKIFFTSGHKDTFLKRCAISKTEHYVRWIHHMQQAIVNNDIPEVKRRQKYLAMEGIKPPKTEIQCEKLIKDLRAWREI